MQARPLAFVALLLSSLIAAAPAAPVPLFDGKSLSGWDGDPKVWHVEDGALVGEVPEGQPQSAFLAAKRTYQNFRLRLEYKIHSGAGLEHGGVLFRSHPATAPSNGLAGYRADIGSGVSGRLYDEGRRNQMLAPEFPVNPELEKPVEWNRFEIRCEGARISLLLNGKMTADYSERSVGIEKSGLIGLMIQGAAKAKIAYRNVSIEELPEDLVPSEAEILHRFGDPQAAGALPAPFVDGKFAMGDHEVVVFAGQTNLVREQQRGELEAQLAVAFAAKHPHFRSMAWEADTVYEQWRDLNFGSWTGQLQAVGATMIVAQFGQMEAFDGQARLPEFTAAYHRLLNDFAARTPRMVLLSPMPFEKPLASHAPDLTQRNADVRAYAEAVRNIAQHRGAVFIDLYTPLSQRPTDAPRLTDNGMHLNDTGLHVVADLIAKALGAERQSTDNLGTLREAIAQKNHLWTDCWRPANWSFVYGDRVTQLFGKPGGDAPSLRETFEHHKPLIAALDAAIDETAGKFASNKDTMVSVSVLTKTLPTSPTAEDPSQSPEAERDTFTLAEGYEINLFASERDGVVKPSQISWDENGRLYVACSPTYPHLLAGAKPGDYILALEDTHGQGYADKAWKYAEGLTMVQGIEPGGGGLYVCDFDKLELLRDTKGSGHADEKKILFSGFGVGDTHQLINSITHGPDGTLWFTQGLHNFSRVETPWGIARLDKAGVWRLHPRTLKLDAFFNGGKAGANCWGVAFDDYGQVFHKSGDRPEGYYTVPGMIRLSDPDEYHPVGPMFKTTPKTTSLEFIGTKALPDDIQGCVVIGGYFGNVVELHRVLDDGAGFRSEQLPKLLRSSSTSFRPVDVSVGPDGAIYVADWYNPVIGHYQASYADPKRDKVHGRIWRISAKGRAPVKQPDLASMKPKELLDQMRSHERWTSAQAKRLLFDLPTDEVIRAADTWIANLAGAFDASELAPLVGLGVNSNPNLISRDEYERVLLELIGVYEAHESVKTALLDRVLVAKDPRVRAYGARVIGGWADRLHDPLGMLRRCIHDENPRVRLEAVVACSYVEKPEAVEVAIEALDSPHDRFIDYALAQCVRSLKPQWRAAAAAKQLTFGGNAAHAAYFHKVAEAAPVAQHPGKVIYDSLCLNCHQPDGKGLPGIYPPLAGSEWVKGDSTKLIRMLLQGLIGPIQVSGQEFGRQIPLPMPPSGLSDQQIADVLTYVRSNYGPKAESVLPTAVETLRAKTRDRTALWTPDELQK